MLAFAVDDVLTRYKCPLFRPKPTLIVTVPYDHCCGTGNGVLNQEAPLLTPSSNDLTLTLTLTPSSNGRPPQRCLGNKHKRLGMGFRRRDIKGPERGYQRTGCVHWGECIGMACGECFGMVCGEHFLMALALGPCLASPPLLVYGVSYT